MANVNHVFRRVGGARPGRSLFNLSYEKKLTMDMGQLIPVMCDEVLPGDIWDIGASAVVRFQPLVAPVMHQVDMYAYYFFVPYRLLWSQWEDFLTGGPSGTLVPDLPRWCPYTNPACGVGSLWDYMGMPLMAEPPIAAWTTLPMDFPRRAYAFLWNEYFRDQTHNMELQFDPIVDGSQSEQALRFPLDSAWSKDYFTSALPWQQRGTAPAIPLGGYSSAYFPYSAAAMTPAGGLNTSSADARQIRVNKWDTLPGKFAQFPRDGGDSEQPRGLSEALSENNVVDLTEMSPISVSDMRLAFQVQRFLERNARAGARYTEYLKAQYNTSPRDDRLDRPEYIGGFKTPLIFSEVLQTSETADTPQGNLAGHGLSVASQRIGRYRVQEPGLIMGIMRIIPKAAYQQGINRQWLRRTRYDFYAPVFAHLSEQAIERGEIYWTNHEANNKTVFGFSGAYDEYRTKQDIVCGQMRTVYDYWHISRIFAAPPVLNGSFLSCNPRKDILAVPSEPALIVQYGNILRALRPMPVIAEPGLIDHG